MVMTLVDSIHDGLGAVDLVHGYQAPVMNLGEAVILTVVIIIGYVLPQLNVRKEEEEKKKKVDTYYC